MLHTKNPNAPPPVSEQPRHPHRQTIRACPGVHNRQNRHRYSGTSIWRQRARGNRISKPAALAPEIQGGERRFETDGGGLCGVACEQATPLGRLPCSYDRKADSTGQTDRGQAGQGGWNLATTNVEMCTAGDRVQSKGGIRDGVVGGRGGIGFWGGDTCYAPLMSTEHPWGGLGVYPRWCAKCLTWGELDGHDVICPEQMAQWRAVHIQLLPSLGCTSGEVLRVRVRPLVANQGGSDTRVPLSHDHIWNRGSSSRLVPPGRPP